MKTNRFIVFLMAVLGLIALAYTVSAADATTTPPASDSVGLGWLIPLLAPIIVTGMKKIPGLFESKVARNLLPYVCIGVAILLTLVLNWAGQSSLSVWIAGPVAGAIGIGARELLDKGMGLLGVGDSGVKQTGPIDTPMPGQNQG